MSLHRALRLIVKLVTDAHAGASSHRAKACLDVGEPANLFLKFGIGMGDQLGVEAYARHDKENVLVSRAVCSFGLDDPEIDPALVAGQGCHHRFLEIVKPQIEVSRKEVSGS